MSFIRRPYFEDGAETIHFSQRGVIKFDPRSVNHCLIIKDKERDRERRECAIENRGKEDKGKGKLFLEKRGKECNKTNKNKTDTFTSHMAERIRSAAL